MQTTPRADGWEVTPPSYRFDIAIEADLIEEVARIVGFEAIPEADAFEPQRFRPLPEERPAEESVLAVLAQRSYQEAITYAFVDPALQERLFPDRPALALSNPIASDLSVMPVSLSPGLQRACCAAGGKWAGSASCIPFWCRRWILHIRQCSSSSMSTRRSLSSVPPTRRSRAFHRCVATSRWWSMNR